LIDVKCRLFSISYLIFDGREESDMKAADIMTRNVITVAPDTSVFQAAQLMLEKRISGLPVVDKNGHLVGMVTEGDFLRRTETDTERRRSSWLQFLTSKGQLADEYVHAHGRKVEEIMSRDPQYVSDTATLEDVVRLMEDRGIKRVPVLRGDTIVGLVTRANLLQVLASVATAVPAVKKSDADLREQILAEFKKLSWCPAGVNVLVRNGDVELWGSILDERQRGALKVVVENIPGVKTIHDHIFWVEPFSGTAFPSPEDEHPASVKASN
jgi:CBS domain-containing protein